MRILILGPTHISSVGKFLSVENPNNFPAGYYGAPVLSTIIGELLKRGHEVISVTTTPSLDNDYQVKKFVNGQFTWFVVPARKKSFGFNGLKLGRILDFFALERREMVKILKHIKPDIIHAHWSYEFATAAIDANVAPYVITVHDNHWKVLRYMPHPYRFLRAIMAEMNLARLQHVTTVSPYMASFLRKRVENVDVVPNPIKIKYETPFIHRAVQRKMLNLGNPKLVMVNNGWAGIKNGKFGLNVLLHLKRYYPTVELHLIGQGSEDGGKAHKDVKQLGLESFVTFHGVITNESLLELLVDTHILLHTTREESFGVVLAEAASLGVPAFGFYIAGAVPWVIGDSSLLYDQWDAGLVAKKISTLLSDRFNYERKCYEAYARVLESFSVESVVTSYENIYHIRNHV